MAKPVLIVFGTRPEAIKMAPVIEVARASTDISPVIAVTAQHREMLDQVLALFDIDPDFDVGVLKSGQSLTDITTKVLNGIGEVIRTTKPGCMLVQGDTTTTFASSLAGFYEGIPVAHLEAGLRSGELYDPFPEELNRRLTTVTAGLHLAPTPASKANLLNEGVQDSDVIVTGNTVIDALYSVLSKDHGNNTFSPHDLSAKWKLLVTAHRREAWGPRMEDICHALYELATTRDDILIVFPIHKNPKVRESFVPRLSGCENIRLLEPLDYAEFVQIMSRVDIILTDSGGMQEEGPSLEKPVLVMRNTTERPEAVSYGTAKLVGTSSRSIVESITELMDDSEKYVRMARAVNPYGDGRAASRVVRGIKWFLGMGERPEEFDPEALSQKSGE